MSPARPPRHRAGDQLGPGVDVALRVADDGRLAGRAARRVDTGDPLARHGEHPVGVVVAQVLLGRERESGEVGQRPEIVRVDAGGVEAGAVMGNVVVGMPQRPFQALGLQRRDFVAAGGFDGVQAVFILSSLLNSAFSWHRQKRA
jgi:hypothetical protein